MSDALKGLHFPHELDPVRAAQVGLIVLQSDETIETDFRQLIPTELELLVSRIPSGAEVTPDTLAAMEGYMTASAALFPQGADLAAVGYGCTSGTAQIGAAQVAARIRKAIDVPQVTEPVSALIAACRSLGVRRLAMLSPYLPEVSERLREVLAAAEIDTPVFGSFEIEEEARVVRISASSIVEAGAALIAQAPEPVDALFLSCTNLRALPAIDALEAATGLPVLASNSVLAWHLARLAGQQARGPGRLLRASPPPLRAAE
ncbi:Asp/Glu racemase [Salipiger sp. CCB-MM3]|uniref:maleate cis-trans isomerase family protein n=1 Tax=Salipiger sp. CCB-MM3 TaxID=1792508 RepID=UPI00080AA442|nr:aspartate/glutamate racemase family protein [Salipiger sp. CCB-MM3]ANT59175.1 Asp/Glu racemase [Salipiger sp. CCB-MM3]